MKYIVAPTPEQAGKGSLDFSWTKPGEPLLPGSKCTSGHPGDGCGCCRAMVGSESTKGTTIGVIAEIDMTPEQIAKKWACRFSRDTLSAKRVKEIIENTTEQIIQLVQDAEEYEVGTRVGFMFNTEGEFYKMEIFEAGSKRVTFGV